MGIGAVEVYVPLQNAIIHDKVTFDSHASAREKNWVLNHEARVLAAECSIWCFDGHLFSKEHVWKWIQGEIKLFILKRKISQSLDILSPIQRSHEAKLSRSGRNIHVFFIQDNWGSMHDQRFACSSRTLVKSLKMWVENLNFFLSVCFYTLNPKFSTFCDLFHERCKKFCRYVGEKPCFIIEWQSR